MEKTSSKEKKITRKKMTVIEYKRMTKVHVLLDRLDVDTFQRTGKVTFLNKKGLDNVHVSKFLNSKRKNFKMCLRITNQISYSQKRKRGEILKTRQKADILGGTNALATDTANNIRVSVNK